MKLVQEEGRYQLESPLNTTLDEYLHMLEILTEKLDLRDAAFLNDYDRYYYTFTFNNVEVLASYCVSPAMNAVISSDFLNEGLSSMPHNILGTAEGGDF